MDKTLFNLHDLILLLTAFESLAIVVFLFVTKKTKNLAICLLIAFFAVRASISFHELVLWGSTFRYWVLDLSPNLFLIFNFSYWLDAPLIYLYVCAVLNPNFKLKVYHLAHAILAAVFIGYLIADFYLLPVAVKDQLIRTYSFADLDFVTVDFIAKLVRLIYLAAAIRLIQIHFKQNEQGSSPPWLLQVIIAYTAILGWELVLSAMKVYHSIWGLSHYDLVEIIGLSDYYMLFALTNVVVFLAVNHFSMTDQQKRKIAAVKEPVNMEYVTRLETAMEQDKLYLNPNLSFERMAEKVDIPVKDLSATINRHYQINFYEFINNYRINEAKRLLEDPAQNHRSITDIFYDAGFNSKSVYNTLFKKKFNMTPSQFRKTITK
ncbi:helix-turn-helix transcriptional regulator [Catenovulum sp. 2E275]|uniref:helix-turn-helix domain-containing protein n=1 Tax=Catenovulum sp. 2E275 TaxID=2980497 RepID=UPI0021D03649|nr:response regulator transcription factor [Catenovulum sp. 2E275]MCU4674098.1 helix-turn-helix transcriptional regulator [Catenovulum sp. 2E275]